MGIRGHFGFFVAKNGVLFAKNAIFPPKNCHFRHFLNEKCSILWGFEDPFGVLLLWKMALFLKKTPFFTKNYHFRQVSLHTFFDLPAQIFLTTFFALQVGWPACAKIYGPPSMTPTRLTLSFLFRRISSGPYLKKPQDKATKKNEEKSHVDWVFLKKLYRIFKIIVPRFFSTEVRKF